MQLVEFQVKDERELDRMVRDVVIGKAIMYKVYDPRARRSKTGVNGLYIRGEMYKLYTLYITST